MKTQDYHSQGRLITQRFKPFAFNIFFRTVDPLARFAKNRQYPPRTEELNGNTNEIRIPFPNPLFPRNIGDDLRWCSTPNSFAHFQS